MFESIGADIYKTWSEDQRRAEIGKLVEGHRAGLPLKILFQMASAIAGSPDSARDHLAVLIPADERHKIVTREKGAVQALAASFLM